MRRYRFVRAFLSAIRDFVYPPACCACDALVAPTALFCAPCSVSVEPTGRSDSMYWYGGGVATAIHRMKFGDRPDLASRLAPALATVRPLDPFDLVVPVSLHARRLRTRRYNVAALLARGLHRPIAYDLLARTRNTTPQAELHGAARRDNVAGAFVVRRALTGLSVLVLDDVYTTGATAHECRRSLLTAGAATVEILTLARTMPP